MTEPQLVLHDYWRSAAAYRVRIALGLKGLTYDAVAVDLRAGAQTSAAYRALNPQGLVPTLEAGGRPLSQSGAILEWLEETYPTPPLLPAPPDDRQIVRAMVGVIGCDIHPLNNLRVLNALRATFHATDDQIKDWAGRWIGAGFEALEVMTGAHGGQFAFGDEPTLADCHLVPQVYSAERFRVDLAPFPTVRRVVAQAQAHPAFQAAHPDRVREP
jgi:maleylpyruvate isomerase